MLKISFELLVKNSKCKDKNNIGGKKYVHSDIIIIAKVSILAPDFFHAVTISLLSFTKRNHMKTNKHLFARKKSQCSEHATSAPR